MVRARAITGSREKVPLYGLSRGTDSTAPLDDMIVNEMLAYSKKHVKAWVIMFFQRKLNISILTVAKFVE